MLHQIRPEVTQQRISCLNHQHICLSWFLILVLEPVHISSLPIGQTWPSSLEGSRRGVQGEDSLLLSSKPSVVTILCSGPVTDAAKLPLCPLAMLSPRWSLPRNSSHTYPYNDLLLQVVSGLCLPESFLATSTLQVPVVAEPPSEELWVSALEMGRGGFSLALFISLHQVMLLLKGPLQPLKK